MESYILYFTGWGGGITGQGGDQVADGHRQEEQIRSVGKAAAGEDPASHREASDPRPVMMIHTLIEIIQIQGRKPKKKQQKEGKHKEKLAPQ